jgi:hypothetical protein
MGNRSLIGEDYIIVFAAIYFVDTQIGLLPMDSVPRFSIAGNLGAISVFTRCGNTPIISPKKPSSSIIGHIGRKCSLPRFVKGQYFTPIHGMVQDNACIIHRFY